MVTKICTKCKIEKLLNEFYKCKENKDGFRNSCKTCNYTPKVKPVIYECQEGFWKCTKCTEIKELIEFNKYKKNRNGYSFQCKECVNKRRRNNRKIEREIRENFTIKPKNGYKICTKCGKEKCFDDFYKNKTGKNGHKAICRECDKIRLKEKTSNMSDEEKERIKNRKKEYGKEYNKKHKKELAIKSKIRWKAYYEEHKEKVIKRTKKYVEEHKEERIIYLEKYNTINAEKIKEKVNKRNKKRKQTDPLFKLACNLRNLIYTALRKNGYNKNSRSEKILGCSFEKFKMYIESKFEPWMNWNNYGKHEKDKFKIGWDVDHFIPPSSVNTEEEILKLNHYLNLQPLCSHINRDIKKDRLDWTTEEQSSYSDL